MYDLRTNMDISAGHCHCHSSLDLVLDATGDLSLISDQDELKQRFFLYLATPKGERYDPNVGCSCLDYLHEKNTRGNLTPTGTRPRSRHEISIPRNHHKDRNMLNQPN